jgi:hypothetical protein
MQQQQTMQQAQPQEITEPPRPVTPPAATQQYTVHDKPPRVTRPRQLMERKTPH